MSTKTPKTFEEFVRDAIVDDLQSDEDVPGSLQRRIQRRLSEAYEQLLLHAVGIENRYGEWKFRTDHAADRRIRDAFTVRTEKYVNSIVAAFDEELTKIGPKVVEAAVRGLKREARERFEEAVYARARTLLQQRIDAEVNARAQAAVDKVLAEVKLS